MTTSELEVFPQEFPLARLLGDTITRNVFRISDTHVAKIPTQDNKLGRFKLQYEHGIIKDAYEAGLPVPKPEGIFNVPLKCKERPWTLEHSVKMNALVMEYIEGVNVSSLCSTSGPYPQEYYKALKQIVDSLERARKLGFFPLDQNLRNAIWNPQQEKVYLIDFEHWIGRGNKRK